MSTNANASAAQGPEIGSDEWVAQTLKSKGIQGGQPEEFSDDAVEAQDDTSDASGNVGAVAATGTTTAQSWRDVVIPIDDESVPQHFRGKPVVEYEVSRRELERQWNEDRKHMREVEAKLAATETLKEFIAEQRAAATPLPTPSDSYRAAGIDLETDPVLNPTKFFPKQEQLILEKAKQLVAEELAKRDVEAQRQQTEMSKVNRMAAALGQIEKQRGLTEAQMKQRIPSIMMTANEMLGQDALTDGDKLLAIHDSIFGAPVQAAIPQQQSIPNPPGVKRPASIEPSPKGVGVQLKAYEREILGQITEEIVGNSGIQLDPERLMARYAANLKRARG
jgi:hypothetical protein